MGVDFFDCDVCGESICDAGDYESCSCGRNWCSMECAEVDEFEKEHCKLGYDMEDNECEEDYCCDCDNYIDESSCKYCREEDFEDNILLAYALQELNFTRADLIKQYKDSKK